MAPRLRSMTVDGDRTILVLDRADEEPRLLNRISDIAPQFQAMAERIGLAGALIFAGPISLDDEQDEANGMIRLHPDEIDALVRTAEKHDGDPDANILGLLAERAHQATA